MIKIFTAFICSIIFFMSHNQFVAQTSCPSVDKKTVSDLSWSTAPGDFTPAYSQNNAVASTVVGTQYQHLNIDPSTKKGEYTFKWNTSLSTYVPVITRVWLTDVSGSTVLSNIVFGPPSPVASGADKVTYCYYGQNLPTTGKISFEFTNPTSGNVTLVCSKDLKTNGSVSNPVLTSYAPTIVSHPLSQTYLEDGVAIFNSSAIAAASFKWQYSTNGTSWYTVPVSADYSFTSSQLTILNRKKYKNYSYRVVYTNYYGSVNSNSAILSVDNNPTVVFSSTLNCDVTKLTSVYVLLTGIAPWSFVYTINDGTPITVAGVNTSSYSLPVNQTNHAIIKLLSVTDAKYTNNVLTGNTTFSSYKKSGLINSNFNLTQKDTVFEIAPLDSFYNRYSIYRTLPALSGFSNKSNTLFVNGVARMKFPVESKPGSYNFNVILSNVSTGCKSDTLPVSLSIQNLKLAIIAQPQSATYLENGEAIFSLSSENVTNFQWQYTFNNGITWNDISSGGNFIKVTKDSLIINNRIYYKNNKFRIVLYGEIGSLVSNTVTLTVNRKPIAFFESTKKCFSTPSRSVIVYLKGTAPYSFTYSVNNALPIAVSNVTKDVYTLNLPITASEVKLLTMSDTRYANVTQDSSNVIRFYAKPLAVASFETTCLKDSIAKLNISGSTSHFTLVTGTNPIPGFSALLDVPKQGLNSILLPKNLPIGTYNFLLTVRDSNCVSDQVIVPLTLNTLPVVVASASKYTIASGEVTELTASGGVSYVWSPSLTLSATNLATVQAIPTKTTIYTVVGTKDGCSNSDTVKVNVNSTTSTSPCTPLSLIVDPSNIIKSSCTTVSDGQITFTVANGSDNNKYRIRRKNVDGSFTMITYPAFMPLNNLAGETKNVTVSNLLKGAYDLFVFCGADTKVTKVYNFTIASNCDTVEVKDTVSNTGNENYTCSDMVLSLENADITPVSCDNISDGKVVFTISGGAPNFTYRLRKKNFDNSYTVISNPVYVSIGNSAKEVKRVTIADLNEGEYELFVFCSQDVSFNKNVSFYISKENCRSLLKDVISYYSFDKNNNDSLRRASAPIVSLAIKSDDNYGNLKGAYRVYGSKDYVKFENFADIDTLNEYTISFWYKLLSMPTSNNSVILTVPNGTSSKRLEVVADKNGDLKVQFGGSISSILNNTGVKVELGTWNQLILTHAQDSDKVYLNEQKIGSFKSATFTNNNTDFIFGYNGTNKIARYNFDEFKFYDKAISYEDIVANYFADVRENCSSIRLNVEVIGSSIKFNVAYGSSNNKYRLRKKNTSGNFVTITNSAFISLQNRVGESKEIDLSGMSSGIYDIYAYCGSDSKKYQGYEFIIDSRGNASVYKKITPTETIETEVAPVDEIYVNVYPNPVDNVINVDILGAQDDVDKTIRLVSSNGVVVHTEKFNSSDVTSSINVEHLRAGVYFLEIQMQDNRVERKQIVIN